MNTHFYSSGFDDTPSNATKTLWSEVLGVSSRKAIKRFIASRVAYGAFYTSHHLKKAIHMEKMHSSNFQNRSCLVWFLVLVGCFGMSGVGLGQSAGFNNTFIVLSLNGGANTFYDLNAATANTDFNGASLGTFAAGSSNLILKGAQHNVYKCGSADLTSTRLNYRIYPTGSPNGSYTAQNIGYTSTAGNGCGGQDQQWSNTGLTTNLLTGLGAGAYTIEVYSDATVTNCCGGTVYASNSGNNYKATFTVSGIEWTNTGTSTTWYTNTNWTPNTTSAQWLTGSHAVFQNAGTATEAAINMNTASLTIGAIEITSARTRGLLIGNSSTSADGTLTLNGLTINGNSNVILRNNASSSNLLTLQNTAASGNRLMTIALGNSTTNVIDAASPITISSAISGASRSITKIGSGTLTLSGTNTYSGGTIISGGTVSAGSAANLGDATGAITLGSGSTSATLAATGTFTRNTVNITTSSSAGVIDVAASQTLTVGALNTASGTDNTTKIGKSGAGTLTLSGAGSYVGQTQIGQGTIIVSNNAGLGTNNSTAARGIDLGLNVGDVSQANNVSVLATTGITVPQSIYVAPNTSSATRTIGTSGASASATFSNEVYLDGTATLAPVSGGTLTMSGNIIFNGGLTTTTGTTLLSGTNTYTGSTSVNSGTLQLGSTSSLGTTAAGTSITSGAVLDLNGINYSSAEALTVNGTGISSGGAIINGSATGATYAGLLTLGSASSIVGGTGTIAISNIGTITGSGFGLTLGGAQGGSLTSIIGTGTGTLTKQDAGTWTLSGANTYSGTTTISGGTLALSGSGVIGTGNISIASGATFNVSSKTTNVAFGASQALSIPATGSNATSTITVGSDDGVTLGSTGGLTFTAYGGGATAPLTVGGATAGALALNVAPITVTTTSALAAGTYTLIAVSGSATGVSGTPGTLTVTGSGLASGAVGFLSVSGGQLILNVNLPATVTTTVAANTITNNSASSGGQTLSGSSITSKGVVWNTATAPTVALSTKTNDGTGTANFTSSLTPLSPQTLYYIRAYATNGAGTGYGDEKTFRTLSNPPTAQASVLSATPTASGQLTVSWTGATFPSSGATQGGYALIYSTGTPTLSSANGASPAAGVGTLVTITPTNLPTAPALSSIITGLTPGTAYNFILVPFTWDGTNAATYNYLTTSAPTASATAVGNPTITTTTAISVITHNSASSGGSGISAGGGTISAKGVVWNTATLPTTANSSTNDGTGTASFSSSLSSLNAQTLYYVRAYATNILSTAYGNELTFRTLSNEPTAAATSFTATANGSAQVDLTWSSASFPGSGATANGYIILRRSDLTNPTTTNIADGVAPASLSLPSGTTLAATILSGATTSFSNTGLNASTQYNYIIIPFTWDGTNSATYNYLLTSSPTSNATTDAGFPTISTTAAASVITNNTATSGGSGLTAGGSAITAKGVAFNTAGSPTIANSITNDGSGTTDFSSSLSSLSPQTQYFVRAYATNGAGTAYGNEVSFRTLSNPPTAQASGLAANPTASGQLTVSWSGATFPGSGATQGGYALIYSTGTPTLSSSNGTAPAAGVGTLVTISPTNLPSTPALSSIITGLTAGTTYTFLLVPFTWDGTNASTYNYLTLSASTISGTAVANPAITTTTAISGITNNSGSSGGSGITAGGGTISAKGVVWNMATSPTTANSSTSNGTGTGSFSSSLTSLNAQTLYYVRSYATNEINTVYGNEVTFRTLSNPPTAQASGLAANPTASGQLTVSWSGATFPGSGATQGGYALIYSTGTPTLSSSNGTAPAAGVGTLVTIAPTNLPTTPALSSIISSLTGGTTYNFLLVPFTWDGTNASTYHYLTTGAITASALAISAASVATVAAGSITSSGASSGGNSLSSGGGSILSKGVVWGLSANPTTTSNAGITSDGTGTTSFSSSLTGLTQNTLYNYRAYVTNELGTYYGSNLTFTTLKAEPTNYPTAFACGTTTTTAIPLTWSDAGSGVLPDGYLIRWSTTSYAAISDPVDGTAQANGTGVQNVAQGTQAYTFTGLSSNTTYFFKIWSYTNSGSNINYKVVGEPQTSCATLLAPVTIVTFPSSWSGITSTAPSTSQDANINGTVTAIRGAGLGAVSSGARFNCDGWPTTGTLSLASNTDYITFTVNAATGFLLNLNSAALNFSLGASGTGPSTFGVYSSVGGFASTGAQIGADLSTSSTSVTFPSTGFNGLSSIEIRIYGWGASATTGTGGFASMNLTGNLVTIGTITSGSVSTSLCSGATSVSVPFTYTPAVNFPSGTTTFTAQLSNASGSFASPTTLQNVTSDGSGSQSISATIPSGTATGSGYRIRVISASPSVNGSNNGSNISISNSSSSVAPAGTQNLFTSANGSTLTVTEGATVSSRQWKYGTASGGPYTVNLGTATTEIPNFATPGTYYIICESTFGAPCSITRTSNEVQINVTPATVTYTWIGGTGTAWGTSANWSPAGVPGVNDNVIINVPGTTVLDLGNTSQTVLDFSVTGTGDFTISGNATLTINGNLSSSTSATPSLGCGSTVAIANAGSQTIPAWNFGNLNATGGNRTLSSTGTIGICGAFTRGAGTYTTTGSTVNYNGTGAQTLSVGTYNNLTISNARSSGNLTSPAGTISVAGTFDVSTLSAYTPVVSASSVFDFTSAGAQTIPAFSYGQLNNSGNGARTWASSGVIDIAQGFTPTTATNTITGSTIRYSNTSAVTWNLTTFTTNVANRHYHNLEFVGGASTGWSLGSAFNLGCAGNLTLSGAGTLTLNGTSGSVTWNVDGILSITGSGTLVGSNSTGTTNLNVTGNTAISSGSMVMVGSSTGAGVATTVTTNNLDVNGTGTITLDAASNTANASLVVNGNFTFNSNVANAVNLGSGTNNTNNQIQIKGSFSKSGSGNLGLTGTYSASAGYLFNGATTQTYSSSGTAPSSGFFTVSSGTTLQLNSNFAMATSANSNTLTVQGALNCQGNQIVAGNSANTFSLSSAATLQTSLSTGLAGVFSGFTAGNVLFPNTANVGGVFVFTGTNVNTGFSTFTDLTSAKFYTITWQGSGNLSLDKTVSLNNLNFTNNGLIILGANDLTLQSSASISGGPFSATKMLVADGSGSLIRSISSAGVGIPFTWPIGDNTATAEYAPVTISNITISIAGSIGFRMVDGVAPNLGTTPDYISRYWVYTLTGLTTHSWSNATFSYPAADVVGTEGNIKANAWNSTNSAWTEFSSSSATGGVLTWTSGANQASLFTGDLITGRKDQPLYFRSASNGNWATAATWETSTDPAFVNPLPSAATVPPNNLNSAGISIAHTVAVNNNTTADDVSISSGGILSVTANTLTIANGSAATDLLVNSGGLFQYSSATNNSFVLSAGAALQVNGTMKNNGAAGSPDFTLNAGSTITIGTNATYEHARNAGTIPTATWSSGSICLVTGTTSNTPGGLGQAFHHFTFDCVLASSVNCSSALQTINGNFFVRTFNPASPTTSGFRLSTGTTYTLNVGGNFTLTDGVFDYASGGSGPCVFNVTGATAINGANSQLIKSGAATVTASFTGAFTQNAGTLDFNTGSSSNTTYNFSGDVTFNGTVLRTNGGTHTLNFIKSTGTQQLSFGGTNGSGALTWNIGNGTSTTNTVQMLTNLPLSTSAHSFNVLNGAALDMGDKVLSGTNTAFVLGATGALRIGHASGITTAGTANGNVQTLTRTFPSTSSYFYTGLANQVTGNALPTTLTTTGNLNIASASGVTVALTTNNTTTPTLNLISGLFAVGNAQQINITTGGNVNDTGGDFATGATGGTVNFPGTGTFSGTSNPYNVFASGGVNFGSSTTIQSVGTFRINSGGFVVTNAPFYASGSTLQYNSGGNYGRGPEWNAASGKGYPAHVQISNNTTLQPGGNSNQNTVLNMAGDLTVDAGSSMYLDWGGMVVTVDFNVLGSITLNGNLSLTTTSNKDLYVGGNWTRNTGSNFNDNSRAVFLNGTANQNIGGTQSSTFPYLLLNNSAGATLTASQTVSNTLTLNNGKLTLGNFDLNVTGTTSGASSTRYIITNGTGRLRQTVGGSAALFPVGNSAYNPVTLTNAGTSDTYGVLQTDAAAGGENDATKIVTRHWDINEGTAGGSNLTVLAQWNAPVAQSGEEAANFVRGNALKWMGNFVSGAWATTAATLAGSNPYTYSASGFTGVGKFEVGIEDAFRAIPLIASATPTNVYTGDVVTINGSNLGSVTSVTIGGTAASIVSQSATTMEVAVGVGSSGTLVVTNPAGTASQSGFTYLGYISDNNTDWNTGSTWRGGNVPPSNAVITINSNVTVNGAVANAANTILVNAARSITFGAAGSLSLSTSITNNGTVDLASGGTLTVAGGGVITNHNAFTGLLGTVVASGAITLNGSAACSLGGLTLNNAGTFTTVPTINGILQLNAGGYVSASPIYSSTATLRYNTGGLYNRSMEWNSASGAGYPNNVRISGGTIFVPIGFGGSYINTVFNLAGDLTIDAGSRIDMNNGSLNFNNDLNIGGSLYLSGNIFASFATGNDIFIQGNWVNNGSGSNFTANDRAVFFNGNSQQIIGGSNATPTSFPYLILNNSSGLSLAANTVVSTSLTLTNGKIELNNFNCTFSSGASIIGASADRYFQTNGTGTLIRQVANGVGTVAYPVGPTSSIYAPVVLSQAGTTDNIGLRVVSSSSFTPAVNDFTQMVNLQWFATEATAGGNNLTTTFQWNQSDEASAFDRTGAVYHGSWNSTVGLYAVRPSGTTAGTNPYTSTSTLQIQGALPSQALLVGNLDGLRGCYATVADGNWASSSIWQGGFLPIVDGRVCVSHVLNLSASDPDNFTNITLAAGGGINLAAGRTITLSNGGSITGNVGALGISGAGTVSFAGAGTIDGGGAITLSNVQVNGGLSLTTTPTITGSLQINAGGFLNSAPIYGSAAQLIYNSGNAYGVSNEWTGNSTTAGAGIPASVVVQNTTTLNLPNTNRGIPGSLSINSGALNLNATSGDLYVGGNWTRSSTATFTSNNRAVFFNGTGTQTITITGGGTAQYDYLYNSKPSGTLVFGASTDVVVAGNSGNVLGLVNTSALDLNGRTLTLSGSGGNLLVSGGACSIGGTSGTLTISGGTKVVTSSSGGTLSTSSGITTALLSGMNFGANLTTINGTLQIANGGFVTGNAPTYASGSTLRYFSGTTFGRGLEWSATSGQGYPHHVVIEANGTPTTLVLSNGGSALREIAGNLTINDGGNLTMSTMSHPLVVRGNVSIGGASSGQLILGSLAGGDLQVGGNMTQGTAGTFNPLGREVVMNGSGAQTIGSGLSFTFLKIDNTGSGVTLAGTSSTSNRLWLSNGSLNLGGNAFELGDLSELRRTAGTMSAAPTVYPGTQYDLRYDGNVTTGVEFLAAADRVRHLTVQGGSTVLLGGDKTVNRDINLLGNSTLDVNGNVLSLFGNDPGYALSGRIFIDGNAIFANTGNSSTGEVRIESGQNGSSPTRYSKYVANNAGVGTLTFGPNLTLSLSDGRFDFGISSGTNITTIQGVLQVSAGGSVFPNACNYSSSPASTLRFYNGYDYQVSSTDITWAAGNSGPGVPWNIEVNDPTTDLVLNDARSVRNNLTINNSKVTLNYNGSNNFVIGGNFTRNGTASQFNNPLNKRIVMSRQTAGDQTISVGGGLSQMSLFDLEIAPASGNVVLSGDVQVTNQLVLTTGKVQMGNSQLTLGTNTVNGTLSGADASRYLITNGSGVLKWFTNQNGTYAFPVGDAAAYTPMALSITTGAQPGSFVTGKAVNTAHPGISSSGSANYLNRYWSMEQTGLAPGYIYTADYTYADGDVVGSESLLYPYKFTPGTGPGTGWIGAGGSNASYMMGTGSTNPATNTFHWEGIYSFSDITGNGGGVVLPVSLLYFDAKPNEKAKSVELSWATASETNSDFFEVERTLDGVNFESVLRRSGAGNHNGVLTYSGVDENPFGGRSYYRLRQVDKDGSETLSPLKAVVLPLSGGWSLNVYPNPSTDQLTVEVQAGTLEVGLSLEVLDARGRVVHTEKMQGSGLLRHSLDLEGWEPGLYQVRVTAPQGTLTHKLVLVRP